MQNRLAGAITMAVAVAFTAATAQAQDDERPERLLDRPNLNGIWQALNTADWNLEAHSAEQLEEFWQLGAFGAIPAGQSVVRDGQIPYLPEAAAQRDENRANWPAADPAASCYMPGIPRATYQPFPFQIFQGDGDILMVYPFASTNRVINMIEHQPAVVDTWMGYSNGEWDGDTLVVETEGFNGRTWFDRAGNHASRTLKVTERFTPRGPDHLWYEATIEDPATFSAPWTIEMALYRIIEENAQLLEFKCVPFADMLLYHDLLLPQDDQPEQE